MIEISFWNYLILWVHSIYLKCALSFLGIFCVVQYGFFSFPRLYIQYLRNIFFAYINLSWPCFAVLLVMKFTSIYYWMCYKRNFFTLLYNFPQWVTILCNYPHWTKIIYSYAPWAKIKRNQQNTNPMKHIEKYLIIYFLSKKHRASFRFSFCKFACTIQTRLTQIVKVYFLGTEILDFNGFLKVIGIQNQLPITFCSDIVCNKTLKAKKSTPTHELLIFNILIAH